MLLPFEGLFVHLHGLGSVRTFGCIDRGNECTAISDLGNNLGDLWDRAVLLNELTCRIA